MRDESSVAPSRRGRISAHAASGLGLHANATTPAVKARKATRRASGVTSSPPNVAHRPSIEPLDRGARRGPVRQLLAITEALQLTSSPGDRQVMYARM